MEPNISQAGSRRLDGRRIVITGGASGIGRATARLFQEQGATVILLDRNATASRETLSGGPELFLEVDITDPDAVRDRLAEVARQLGGIDGVVNSAGIMITGPISEMSLDVWQRTIDVNLSGSFYVIKACLPHFDLDRGPTIVNVASAAGLLPNAPGIVPYAASKGGVIAMTKALAAELAPRVRVNCVCPGMVNTPMAVGNGGNVNNYALKRAAEPMEVANAILFLSEGASSYVTGSVLSADGGRAFH